TLLKGHGYDVETAENGAVALEKIKSSSPGMIISDILMPVMDGFALCRECKVDKKTRNIPFIFYTATYTEHSDKELALSLGADKFLIKPLDPAKFIKEIEEVLENFKSEKFNSRDKLPQSETVYLKSYNKALIRKLEKKLLNLEELNISLKNEIEMRKQAEDKLIRQQKVEVIGRLAGSVAHDFNNILSVIYGYTELLIDRCEKNEKAYEYLKEIESAGDRGKALVKQLLLLGRKTDLNPVILNMNNLIAEMKNMLERLVSNKVELNFQLNPESGNILAETGKIDQIIMNLIVNASDAMPDGGELIIKTENIKIKKEILKGEARIAPGEYLALTFEDTGAGIPEEVVPKIFEPFFTTKGEDSGTGLGLSTVAEIMDQCFGFIEVESEIGKGTVFKLYFPLVKENETISATFDSLNDALKGKEMILIVEEENSTREMLGEFLEAYGYLTIESVNEDDAVIKFRENEQNIRLVLVDAMAFDISGKKLMGEISRSDYDIGIIIMSEKTETRFSINELKKAEFFFLHKPFRILSLLRKIRNVIDSN
ncbi:MAG: response regulator, partial [Acidobacteriota bacterium]